jgi:hypothetical protein
MVVAELEVELLAVDQGLGLRGVRRVYRAGGFPAIVLPE